MSSFRDSSSVSWPVESGMGDTRRRSGLQDLAWALRATDPETRGRDVSHNSENLLFHL